MCYRYLSQGVPRQVLAWMFKMGNATIANIIFETCAVLWDVLMPLYLPPPLQNNWEQFSDDFFNKWNLPNCVSAVDGKHINIKCPPNAGSEYYNYKGHHSIVLLAACDANYIFTAVDIGAYGSQSDGGIFADSAFGKKLLRGQLNLPNPKQLPDSNLIFNYYFVGDAAFPLKSFLMRPYPGRFLDVKKENFNKRLSRARRVIENAFGILGARWRILQKTLEMLPTNADIVVKACVVLHNFVKLNDPSYCPSEYVDVYDVNNDLLRPGVWRSECNAMNQMHRIGSNFSSRNATEIRDSLCEYLYINKI